MHGFRLWSRRNYDVALLIVALALCVKALLPPGYMVGAAPAAPAFYLCTSLPGGAALADAAADAPAGEHGQADSHCAFSALTFGALGHVASLVLAALVFVFLLALRPQTLRLNIQRHWRVPPLRGPPAII